MFHSKKTSPLLLSLVCASVALPVSAQTSPSTSQNQAERPVRDYTFVYLADGPVQSVHLAGDFNAFDKTATPMKADADGRTWRVTLPLREGKYFYKFVVNGDNWVNDINTESETDGQGNANSILTLTATGNASELKEKPIKGNADAMFVLTPDKIKSTDTLSRTFVFRSDKKLNSVALAGQFNGWNKDADPMQSDDGGFTWRKTVSLAPGVYQYKFVVDGSQWTVDPSATRSFTEPDGNVNSLLVLTPADYGGEAKNTDGRIARSALRHAPRVPDLNFDQGKLRFWLRARPGDLKSVMLQLGTRQIPMSAVKSDAIYATYSAEIPWDGRTNLSYRFALQDGATTTQFGANGLGKTARPFVLDAKTYRPFQVPEWVEKTVFYQIFPDRFENGDKSNDPQDLTPWDARPNGGSRYGGDVAGIQKRLPYLQKLGISGVYFTPVFQSPSNHRYDATDFKRIDPEFGTNAQFKALTHDLQKRGIRTVMDFVFNHASPSFAPFADVRKNGINSAYKDWFYIKTFPVRVQNPPTYVGWYGYAAMPKINLTHPQASQYMLGLVDYWHKEVPLAGIRLDVADEVDIRFWRQLRERVKGLDSRMWIVGERWSDASPWLAGDQWDAAMNYPFLFANIDYFAEGRSSSTQFTGRLMEIYNSYLPQVSRNMMNILSSHDRTRFITASKNDARLHQLAATVQFTWPGAPSIYYGEEIGLEGNHDPDNRRGMDWNKATPDNPMLGFYQKLIAIRKENRALQSGAPAILMANDAARTFAYSRTLGTDVTVVAINRSETAQSVQFKAPKSRFVNAWNGQKVTAQNGTITLQLAPFSSAILVAEPKS